MLASQQTTMRGSGVMLRAPKPFSAPNVSRGSLQVTAALTRARKQETVEILKERLNSSAIVFGMRFKGVNVATLQKFRKILPEGAQVQVCKNNLMKVAIEQTEGWSELKANGCTGENAWVFVSEDCIPETVKSYYAFEAELAKDAKAAAAKGTEPPKMGDVAVAVMDSKLLTPAQLKACENLPTKLELITTVALLAKQPATKIATGIKAVSTKLATAVKKVSELDEDTSKIVGDLAKA